MPDEVNEAIVAEALRVPVWQADVVVVVVEVVVVLVEVVGCV